MRYILQILLLLSLFIGGCNTQLQQNEKQLVTKLAQCQEEKAELEQGTIIGLNTQIKYLISGSILAIGCFVVLSFVSPKLGILGCSGAGSVLGLSLMTGLHSHLLGWLFLGLFLFGGASVVYHIWNDRKALSELVLTGEKLKAGTSIAFRADVIGAKGGVSPLQSERTSKIVGKIKKKIKKKEG